MTKFDRKSYKARQYNLVVTNKSLYVLYGETMKLNQCIDFADITVRPGELALGLCLKMARSQ